MVKITRPLTKTFKPELNEMANQNNNTNSNKTNQTKHVPTVAVPTSVAKRVVREAAKQNVNRAGQRNILRRLLGK